LPPAATGSSTERGLAQTEEAETTDGASRGDAQSPPRDPSRRTLRARSRGRVSAPLRNGPERADHGRQRQQGDAEALRALPEREEARQGGADRHRAAGRDARLLPTEVEEPGRARARPRRKSWRGGPA